MRPRFLALLSFALVIMIQSATAQDPRGPRGPRELKFTYEHDKELFSSEDEMTKLNNQLAELKQTDPDAYSKIEKNLMERMKPGVGEALPDTDQMVARRLERQKQLKLMVEENQPAKEEEVVKEANILPPLPETKVPQAVVDFSVKTNTNILGPLPETKVPEAVVDFSQKAAPQPKASATVSNRNYKPDTCVWAEDIPRKVVVGAGCSKAGTRICIGYVVCEQKIGGGKFTRMSTCSEGLCGDNDAAACTRQGGYGSFKPKADYKESVSQPIDDVLKNSSKAQ